MIAGRKPPQMAEKPQATPVEKIDKAAPAAESEAAPAEEAVVEAVSDVEAAEVEAEVVDLVASSAGSVPADDERKSPPLPPVPVRVEAAKEVESAVDEVEVVDAVEVETLAKDATGTIIADATPEEPSKVAVKVDGASKGVLKSSPAVSPRGSPLPTSRDDATGGSQSAADSSSPVAVIE